MAYMVIIVIHFYWLFFLIIVPFNFRISVWFFHLFILNNFSLLICGDIVLMFFQFLRHDFLWFHEYVYDSWFKVWSHYQQGCEKFPQKPITSFCPLVYVLAQLLRLRTGPGWKALPFLLLSSALIGFDLTIDLLPHAWTSLCLPERKRRLEG